MMDSVEVVQVIKTKSTRGDGTSADPKREIVQYWDFDGNLIAEGDSLGCDGRSIVNHENHRDKINHRFDKSL